MALFTGALKRIGFDTEGRGFLLTTRVPYRHDQHEVENFLEVLRADGVEIADDFLECWTTPEEECRCRGAAGGCRSLFGKATGGAPSLRVHSAARLAPGKFCRAGGFVRGQGLVPLVLGAPRDRGDFERVRELFGAETVDLVGGALSGSQWPC